MLGHDVSTAIRTDKSLLLRQNGAPDNVEGAAPNVDTREFLTGTHILKALINEIDQDVLAHDTLHSEWMVAAHIDDADHGVRSCVQQQLDARVNVMRRAQWACRLQHNDNVVWFGRDLFHF